MREYIYIVVFLRVRLLKYTTAPARILVATSTTPVLSISSQAALRSPLLVPPPIPKADENMLLATDCPMPVFMATPTPEDMRFFIFFFASEHKRLL